MIHIEHFPGCTPKYPEKPDGELPQAIMVIPIDDGDVVHQCSDCGAYVIEGREVMSESTTEYSVAYAVLSPVRKTRWVRSLGPFATLREAQAAVIKLENVVGFKIISTTMTTDIVEVGGETL